MLHYSLMKKNTFQISEMEELSISYLETMENSFPGVIYVTDKGSFIGCIGRKEFFRSIRERLIIINKESSFVYVGDAEEEDARSIFDSNPKIQMIPVLNRENRIVYEYSRDYGMFYEEVDIQRGVYDRKGSRKGRVVVSMTSYGKRISTVHLAIKSLMYQTMLADRILLYIATEDSEAKLQDEEALVEAGLEIIRGVEDIGAHKKYYYSMQECPEDIVITTDDDQLYDDSTIEKLYEHHMNYPHSVIGMRGHRMLKKNGKIQPYNLWTFEIRSKEPSLDAVATGVSGILYPPGDYRDSFIDANAIISLCLRADDLWLKINEVRNGVKTFIIGDVPQHFIDGSQDDNSLCEYNTKQGGNDKCLAALSEHFKLDLAEFATEL